MRKHEQGFLLYELVVSLAIIAIGSVTMGTLGYWVIKGTEGNTSYMITTRELEDAGFQINRDASMAQTVNTTNISDPNFVVLGWAIWDPQNQPHYHSVSYYFDGLVKGVGRLKRYHWSSDGANENTIVANNVYFNTADPAHSSNATYNNRELVINLTSIYESVNETRQFRTVCRPNYY